MAQPLNHFVVRPRFPARSRHCHPLAIPRITPDRLLHDPPLRFRRPVDESEILLSHLIRVPGLGKAPVGHVVLGHDHDSAGVLIEPVHDAGTDLSADPAEAVEMEKESVDQGGVAMSGSRMNDESRRLLDDCEILILIKDMEGKLLRLDAGGLGVGNVDLQLPSLLEPV
jgi:hypothetical protein